VVCLYVWRVRIPYDVLPRALWPGYPLLFGSDMSTFNSPSPEFQKHILLNTIFPCESVYADLEKIAEPFQ
jgi:hypothetical protein